MAGEQRLAQHGSGDAAGLSMDRAIQDLVALSKRGKLQGRVYGRLNSLAKARDLRYVAACNAALSEQCNLVRSLAPASLPRRNLLHKREQARVQRCTCSAGRGQ